METALFSFFSPFIQKQSILAAENSLFSSYLQFLEKGKTWYKMWVTIPKSEPLVLYLHGSSQVRWDSRGLAHRKKKSISLNMWSWEVGQRIWLGFNSKTEFPILGTAESLRDFRLACYLYLLLIQLWANVKAHQFSIQIFTKKKRIKQG